MNEEDQKRLLDELYTLNNHVWRVKNKEEQPIAGVKYDQFLVKNSDQFGRTVIHILSPIFRTPHLVFSIFSLHTCLFKVQRLRD